jgi:hypothetical protein
MRSIYICFLILVFSPFRGYGQVKLYPPNTKIGIYTDFKQNTYPRHSHTYHLLFDTTGRIIETFEMIGESKVLGMPSALKKGDYVIFKVLHQNTKSYMSFQYDKFSKKFNKNTTNGSLTKENPFFQYLFCDQKALDTFLAAPIPDVYDKNNNYNREYSFSVIAQPAYPDEYTSEKKFINRTCFGYEPQEDPQSYFEQWEVTEDIELIEFKLKKKQTENQLIAQLLRDTSGKFWDWANYIPIINEIKTEYDQYGSSILELLRKDSLSAVKCCGGTSLTKENEEIKNKLDFLCNKHHATVENLLCQIVGTNQGWIQKWLWFTGGEIRLNPFPFGDPAELIAKIEQKLLELNKQNTLLISFAQGGLAGLGPDTWGNVKQKQAEIISQTAFWEKKSAEAKQLKTDYEKFLTNLRQSELTLYRGVLYGSNPKEIAWMNHYDAENKFSERNIKNTLPLRVADRDEVIGLVHNLKAGQKLNLLVTEAKDELQTQTAIALNPFFEAFSSSLKGSADINKLGTSLVFGLGNFMRGRDFVASETSQVLAEGIKQEKEDCPSDYQGKIARFLEDYQKINWLAAQTHPILTIDLKPNNTPFYSTSAHFPEKELALTETKKVNYSLTPEGKDKPVIKATYRKYERIRFWPTAGIAYIPEPRSATLFDNSTGQFRTDTDIDQFEAFVGVKCYFGQTNIAYDCKTAKATNLKSWSYGLKRGNNILNRFFMMGALGVRHKFLKNYLLGLGIDVIPGVSLQGGYNFLLQKEYELENGKIKNEYEKPRGYCYYGVSLDLNLVTKLISLF